MVVLSVEILNVAFERRKNKENEESADIRYWIVRFYDLISKPTGFQRNHQSQKKSIEKNGNRKNFKTIFRKEMTAHS